MDLSQITSMKPSHFARLLNSIQQANVTTTPNEASHPRASMSQILVSDTPSDMTQLDPIPFGPIEVDPTVIMAARDGVVQNDPNEIGPQEVDGSLLKVYDHW